MKPQATGWSMSSDLDLMDFLSLKCGVHSKRKYAIFFSSQRRIMIFVTKMKMCAEIVIIIIPGKATQAKFCEGSRSLGEPASGFFVMRRRNGVF